MDEKPVVVDEKASGTMAPVIINSFAYKQGLNRDPEEKLELLRASIERTEREMEKTIVAIQDKLSYQNLRKELEERYLAPARDGFNRVSERAGRLVSRTGEGVSQTVRGNPVPIAIIGAGLGWLLINSFMNKRNQELLPGSRDSEQVKVRQALEEANRQMEEDQEQTTLFDETGHALAQEETGGESSRLKNARDFATGHPVLIAAAMLGAGMLLSRFTPSSRNAETKKSLFRKGHNVLEKIKKTGRKSGNAISEVVHELRHHGSDQHTILTPGEIRAAAEEGWNKPVEGSDGGNS